MNCLLFNGSKSVHLHCWKQFGLHQYNINGKTVTTADQHKDLGIIISSNLTFSLHYETISAKAYKMLGLLRRASKFTPLLLRKNCILI